MLELDTSGPVSIVRLNHGAVNALDVELVRALAETVRGLGDGQPVVLTGTGKSFSAGVDLKRIADGGLDYVRAFRAALSEAVRAVFYHPGPVVAAVNGNAIAGGCVLAAACDIRFMGQGRIGLTEMRIGVPFPAVSLEVMRHATGPGVRRLLLGAALLTPDEAAAAGLVDHVTAPESILAAAVAEAERLGKISPGVYAFNKRQLQGPARLRIEAISQADEDAANAMWANPATQAAIAAFVASLQARA